MSAIDILRQLKQQGVVLAYENSKLVSKAEKGKLTPELIALIKENKSEIVHLLEASQSVEQVMVLPELNPNSGNRTKLSYGQKRLWLLDQLQQGSSQYNMPCAFMIKGNVKLKELEHAFQQVLERHSALRTCIDLVDGEAVITELAASSFKLVITDAGSDSVSQHMSDFFSASFNLKADLMLKAQVLILQEEKAVLMINMHHIASDGWSIDVFNQELLAFYHSNVTGEVAQLSTLDLSYLDYAAWQQDVLTGENLERLSHYWQHRLKGAPECHSLSLDHPRPAKFDPRGDKVVIKLEEQLKADIQAYCLASGISLNHFLKAAYLLLIQRFSDEKEIVIGSPVANRPLKEMANMVGFFVNSLPFKLDFNGITTVESLLEAVKQHEVLDIEHQHLPFDLMVEQLSPKRDLSMSPLFQVVFAMQNYQAQARDVAGIEMSFLAPKDVLTKYDLSLYIYEHGNSLEAHFEYATSLFEKQTIQSMSESYVELLRNMVAAPKALCTQLEMVSQAQQNQIDLVKVGPKVQTDFQSMHNSLELLTRSSEMSPVNVALRDASGDISYENMLERIAKIQAKLKRLNIEEGDRVALAAPRSSDVFLASFAIMGLGAVYVPLDYNLPTERIEFILQDSAPKLLITEQSFTEKHTQLVVPTVELSSLLDSQQTSSLEINQQVKNKPAYIIYTSGSTGKPKGTVIPHNGLFSLASSLSTLGFAHNKVKVLQFANTCFDASVWEWLTALSEGGALYVLPEGATSDTKLVERFINEHAINHALLPPSYLNFLDREAITCLTTLGTGGEKIELEAAQHWQQGRIFFNAYGPTEVTVAASVKLYSEQPELVTLGTPLTNTVVKVVDSNLHAVPFACPGELLISNDGVALEYLNLAELSAEKFIKLADGKQYYRSGDLVKQQESGELIFLGRKDRQVKIRGFRIELDEIESQLVKLEGVSLAAVKVYQEPKAQLVAYCEVGDNDITPLELKHKLRDILPEYMVPNVIQVIAKLPTTKNGKVNYKELNRPSVTSEETFTQFEGETELVLRDIWLKLLGRQEFGATDSFFDLGGHSLMLTQLLNEIERHWQVSIPMSEVFQAPDIRSIGVLIEALLPEKFAEEDEELEMEGGFL